MKWLLPILVLFETAFCFHVAAQTPFHRRHGVREFHASRAHDNLISIAALPAGAVAIGRVLAVTSEHGHARLPRAGRSIIRARDEQSFYAEFRPDNWEGTFLSDRQHYQRPP